ncbi:TetR/AcrR family transcriptional regulator [Spirillospora sp. NPDC050679]
MSPYHHGNLRPALLEAAAAAIEQHGPAALSLRDLARRAGVSHAAPAHHFGDKTGLLTALAAQGYELLADALEAAGPDIMEAGVAYVRFAVSHRAHFEVMFDSGLYNQDDAEVADAASRADRALRTALAASPGTSGEHADLAAWSIVHGFASLWISGALPKELGDDAGAAALPVISRLFS